MKVGILTFSAAYNFGAVLQCYALYETIKSLGVDVEVIDYRPQYLSHDKKECSIIRALKSFYYTISRFDSHSIWNKVFKLYSDFEKQYLTLSNHAYNSAELYRIIKEKRYDYVVVGSDQVWNPIFNNHDEAWYGYNINNSTKWISYAASAGNYVFSTDELIYLADKIEKFSSVSVRESYLKSLLQQINSNFDNIKVTLDPTLLASTDIWDKWKSPIINNDYIITYQARESDEVFRIAHDLSKQLGDIDIIPIDFYPNVRSNGLTTRLASPSDFISLVSNARCVVTTSFHGTVFSILCKTPFYTLRLNDGSDGRAEELLNLIKLSDRMISCNSTPKFSDVDFSEADRIIKFQRNSSLEFLKQALL